MKTYKEYYFISGRTKSNKFVCVSACTALDIAIDHFKHKYPRFNGNARIYKQECEVFEGNDLVMYSPNARNYGHIRDFTSTKEL
jgi:hypothetical protein